MVVSRISMNVGTSTTTAISQGPNRAVERSGRMLEVMALLAARLRIRPWSKSAFQRSVFLRRCRLGLRQFQSRLQHLAGIRAGRRLAVIDVRHDGQTYEERLFVRVVVSQLDADWQPLHDLDEVAGRVLRRQEG